MSKVSLNHSSHSKVLKEIASSLEGSMDGISGKGIEIKIEDFSLDC